MSRHGKAERQARRRARDELAALGETWLAIREAGAFLLDGFAAWDDYVERRIVPAVRASGLPLSDEQVPRFVAEALRLAEIRRRAGRRPR